MRRFHGMGAQLIRKASVGKEEIMRSTYSLKSRVMMETLTILTKQVWSHPLKGSLSGLRWCMRALLFALASLSIKDQKGARLLLSASLFLIVILSSGGFFGSSCLTCQTDSQVLEVSNDPNQPDLIVIDLSDLRQTR